MFRRNFLTRIALGSVAATLNASETKTLKLHIKGFTCITCAVGLDTMLLQHEGVLKSKSSYHEAVATIEFNPAVTNEKSIKGYISEMGFTAQ